jgi:hypothetical protein
MFVALAVVMLALASLAAPVMARPAKLGPPVASAVEGLPVPTLAMLQPPTAGVSSTIYKLPKGVTPKMLTTWYAEKLPVGQGFGSWTWCQLQTGKTFREWIWTHPGTTELLALTIVNEKKSAPPGILLGVDQSGPC